MSKKHPNLAPALAIQLQAALEIALAEHPTPKHPSSIAQRDTVLDLLTLTHHLVKYPQPSQSSQSNLNEDFGPHTIAVLQSLIHQIDPYHPAGIMIDPASPSATSTSEPEPDTIKLPSTKLYTDLAENYGRGVSHLAQASRALFDSEEDETEAANAVVMNQAEPLHTQLVHPQANPKLTNPKLTNPQLIMGTDGRDYIQ